MTKTLLVIGTRKGLFLAESADRRDWEMSGPFCESWPVYQAVHDASTDTIYAAAASEWHGSAVWRSSDRGETWEHSSEGLAHDDDRKISKVASIAAGAWARARRRRGRGDLGEHATAARSGRRSRRSRASPGARSGTILRTSRRATSASRR